MTVKSKVGRRRYLYVQPLNFFLLKSLVGKYEGKIVRYKGIDFLAVKHFNLEKLKKDLDKNGIRVLKVSGTLKSLYEKLGFNRF
jgi:hypothetical protein